MELKPGYKRTEVGVIPEDWDVYPVRQMGSVLTGKALAVNAPGEPRPYLRTKNVFDGRIVIDDVLTMPMTSEQFAHFRVLSGDVLLNEGQSLELVGRCSLYSDEYPEPCAIQNQLLRFRARAGTSGVFAAHLFRRCQQTGVFARIALQTTSIAHLGGSRFERLLLAWPRDEGEQHAIATALSDVDALLEGLDRLIAKKRDLKQAAMQQLLTGQTRLPGFSGEWEVKRLGEVTDLIPSGAYGEETPRDSLLAYRVATTAHIEMNDTWNSKEMNTRYFTRDQVERCSAQEGDLIVVKSSGSAASIQSGKIGFVDKGQVGQFLFSNFLMLLRPTEIVPRFLYFYLCSHSVKKLLPTLVEASTYPNIRIPEYLALDIRVPEAAEQTAIAAVLSDMDAELAALDARRAKTRALKQAMMQELLTGRTRLT